MMGFPMPQSSIRMSLKYNGAAVDDGSMPISEVIDALKGFSGAYGKTASFLLPDSSHELRVTAVAPGSFDLSILAWVTSSQGTETLKAIGTVSEAAKSVFGIVTDFIKAKKFTKGETPKFSVQGSNNTLIIINNEGDTQTISKEVADLLKSKLIDADISKIASPLSDGFIQTAELKSFDGKVETATTIAVQDKEYFAESQTETFHDVHIKGRIVSDSKDTNRGRFQRGDGKKIPYHYIGESPENFRSVYAFSGSVSVRGIGYFDENLELTRIDIVDASPLQDVFPFVLPQ